MKQQFPFRERQNGMEGRKLLWDKEKRTGKEAIKARAGLAFRDWLTGCTMSLVKCSIYRSNLSFCLLTWNSGQEQLHLGPGNLFQQIYYIRLL